YSIYSPSTSITHSIRVPKLLTTSFRQIRWYFLMSSISRIIAPAREKDLVLWRCLLTYFSTTPHLPRLLRLATSHK
ncbi:unnamed protein product, partial [Hymenolepis diminuta]